MGDRPAKQVLVVRRDLKMRRGKECAQVGHGALAWLLHLMDRDDAQTEEAQSDLPGAEIVRSFCLYPAEVAWLLQGQTKIVVQAPDAATLDALTDAARKAGVRHCHLIIDAGRTEFGGVPTATVLALGPDWADVLDPVTGHLALY